MDQHAAPGKPERAPGTEAALSLLVGAFISFSDVLFQIHRRGPSHGARGHERLGRCTNRPRTGQCVMMREG